MKKTLCRACILCLALTLLCPLLAACGGEEEDGDVRTLEGFAFDTYYAFTVYGGDDALKGALTAQIAEMETLFDAHGEDCIFHAKNPAVLTEEQAMLASLIEQSILLSRETNGHFDPTLGALKRLFALDDPTAPLPSDAAIEAARAHSGISCISYDARTMTLTRKSDSTLLDFGAIAKGFALSRLTALCLEHGATGGMLDFGGTVSVFGEKKEGTPYKIGVRGDGTLIGTLTVKDAAVISVSSSYERYKEFDGVRYSHIFDPATGRPAESDLALVLVSHEDGAIADAYSTALYVMGKEKARAFCEGRGVAAVLVACDGSVTVCGDLDYTERKGS